MSITVLFAICILSCDFLLYVLYQWTYGEKRRGLSRRSQRRERFAPQQNARPFPVPNRRNATEQKLAYRSKNRGTSEAEAVASGTAQMELRAYRRIVSSFAQAKR